MLPPSWSVATQFREWSPELIVPRRLFITLLAPSFRHIRETTGCLASEFSSFDSLVVSILSILWLWALRALSFFDQLIFTFSVFEIEVDVFDHLQLLLGLSSEVTIFNLRHTLLGLSSEILNIITFTV